MNAALRALTSMKLAIVLIGYLALACLLATLIPELSGFFGSVFFLAPAALFFLSLGACAATRFLRARRGPKPRRHGPDILHLGLLLFMIAAALSAADRRGEVAYLAEGDAMRLQDGSRIRLERLETERYADGRPREWTSWVSVERDGQTLASAYPLRVNHPLSLGNLKLYQASRGSRAEADSGGSVELSGLMVVRDSYFGLVLASLAIIAAGLAITFIQKLGELPK